ncbi:hypothetical protein QP860_03500 [Aerococcus sp. UMB1112A]|uniref:hypothetical protein n=1 Tax=Aerococcus sp. UMB1112A TaxID=3050609 RepID=UPI00254A3E01|nr:hypothetical protein [Aerococcus sp. UMB1112A]MDK8502114.1 hypothetical protein [Aerococcus sp. UMB1112A]
MEKQNYLTVDHNRQLASKLSPLIRVIEMWKLTNKSILVAGASPDHTSEMLSLEKEANAVALEAIVYDFSDVLVNVYSSLIGSGDEEVTKENLSDLGIK